VIRGHLEPSLDRKGKPYLYFVRDGQRLAVPVCPCDAVHGEPCRDRAGKPLPPGFFHAARVML
jgi:hypothetical protein